MLVKGEAAGGRGIQGQGSWQLQAEVLCGAGFWPRRELFPGLAGVRGAESITSVSHCRYLGPVETDSQKTFRTCERFSCL